MASVILIRKPGEDPKLPWNFRPISLLSHTFKVFERLVQRRVRDHLRRHNVLIPEQFGFRAGHSSTQLMRLVETITGAGCSREQTVALFLYMEQACDCVWHEGLLHKLRETLLPDYYIHLLASFLRNSTFRVRVYAFLSQERAITAGVPQGSVLGHLLFSAYVNDVLKLPEVQLSVFADYTVPYAVARHADYQRQIDAYVDWTDKWRVSVNASKSTVVVFSRRRKLPRSLRIGRT